MPYRASVLDLIDDLVSEVEKIANRFSNVHGEEYTPMFDAFLRSGTLYCLGMYAAESLLYQGDIEMVLRREPSDQLADRLFEAIMESDPLAAALGHLNSCGCHEETMWSFDLLDQVGEDQIREIRNTTLKTRERALEIVSEQRQPDLFTRESMDP